MDERCVKNGRILVIVKDTGGSHAVIPASTLADFGDLSDVVLVLTSICSEGGVGKTLAEEALRRKIAVVAVQDHFDIGEHNENGWRNGPYPSLLVLPHYWSIQATLDAWPGMRQRTQDILIEWPAFDRFREKVDRKACSAALRARLNITDPNVPLIAIMGSGSKLAGLVKGAATALKESGAILLIKAHPKMETKAPHELALAQQVVAGLGGDRVRWITDKDVPNTDKLIPAVEGVVSEGSTTLVEAARRGTPPIAFGNKEPPSSKLGLVAYAYNSLELIALVGEAVSGKLTQRLRPAWDRYLPTRGGAADTVADHIVHHILPPA